MANIVAIQEQVNGVRHLELKVDIEGDGSGEIDEILVDVGEWGGSEVSLGWVRGQINGFSLNLQWDGPTLAPLRELLPDNYIDFNWEREQRLTNPKVAGYDGNVRMTSVGLESGERGSLNFGFYKKRINSRVL